MSNVKFDLSNYVTETYISSLCRKAIDEIRKEKQDREFAYGTSTLDKHRNKKWWQFWLNKNITLEEAVEAMNPMQKFSNSWATEELLKRPQKILDVLNSPITIKEITIDVDDWNSIMRWAKGNKQ